MHLTGPQLTAFQNMLEGLTWGQLSELRAVIVAAEVAPENRAQRTHIRQLIGYLQGLGLEVQTSTGVLAPDLPMAQVICAFCELPTLTQVQAAAFAYGLCLLPIYSEAGKVRVLRARQNLDRVRGRVAAWHPPTESHL